MFNLFRGWDVRREWLAYRTRPGPLKDFYRVPYPWPEDDYKDIEYVALDLETTGLRSTEHEIISIGWILIRDQALQHKRCGHQLIKPTRELTEDSAVIHGITHDELESAPSLEEGLARVLPDLQGRVLVAHHARIEWKFLDAACRKVYDSPFEIPTVDTMVLEKRRMGMRQQQIAKGALRLDAVRQRYNLPRYKAHNALIDAVACGELFLAQAQYRMTGKGPHPLRELSI